MSYEVWGVCKKHAYPLSMNKVHKEFAYELSIKIKITQEYPCPL